MSHLYKSARQHWELGKKTETSPPIRERGRGEERREEGEIGREREKERATRKKGGRERGRIKEEEGERGG